MRLLAFFLILLVSLSAHSQTVGSCAASDIGSPSCPYQWVGATSVAFAGNGNGLGYVGMTTQCRADFGPGARMCTSQEIMDSDTLNLNAIPGQGCWVRPAWRPLTGGGGFGGVQGADESGLAGTQENLSCGGWSIPAGATGLAVYSNGHFGGNACANALSVACCKPRPVGEPQASLLLPAGVGILAGMTMLRGVSAVGG